MFGKTTLIPLCACAVWNSFICNSSCSAFGFEKLKFLTPYVAAVQGEFVLSRVDVVLVRNGAELVGLRVNTQCTAASASPDRLTA